MGIVKPDLHNSVKTRVLLYKSQLKHSTSGSAPYSGKQTKPRNIENQESGVALASWPVGRLPWPVGRLAVCLGQLAGCIGQLASVCLVLAVLAYW